MIESQSRMYKTKGKYDDHYVWLVQTNHAQWELIEKASKYRHYYDIGKRGACVENGELIVSGLLQHSFEQYLLFCENQMDLAKPLKEINSEFTITVKIELEPTESKYLLSIQEKLISVYPFKCIKPNHYILENAPPLILVEDGLSKEQISIHSLEPVNTCLQNEEDNWINSSEEVCSFQQLSIF